MKTSIDWYSKMLGLEKHQLEEWGDFPIFMLAGKSGIAIFPKHMSHEKPHLNIANAKSDHFAFNVSNEDFEKAQKYFNSIDEPFQFQDHHYFHSIYLKDPDNYTVELTTLLINENEFYN